MAETSFFNEDPFSSSSWEDDRLQTAKSGGKTKKKARKEAGKMSENEATKGKKAPQTKKRVTKAAY